ncbi:site-specific integrase [Novosphingobium sp. PASSN1]|uniref:tyrosine-type recombinase/integrase n=1 Tax=Novosphingobium sp. PASSN1 TaxID=2015561 RepID=UPI000BCF96EC|nr:site-specific integrase [Novosphingobium sp. PASSN1]OYU35257.1 MAG: integrase [Novosphingobium sp. PASSN1]
MAQRSLNKLSATFVAKTKEPGRHSDGGGLYLAIDGDGRRRWLFMYTRAGKRTELGIGSGRDLKLADARALAGEMRAAIERGDDPRSVRAKDKPGQTFGEFADVFVADLRPSWKNAKHAAQWETTLKQHAAKLRPLRLDQITTADVLAVLKPIWSKTPETAERLRGRIERVLDAAKAVGLRSGENPAQWKGNLKTRLPPRTRLNRGNHTALPYEELPGFMERLRAQHGTAALLLEFTILTAVRTGEALGAKWGEVDLEKAVWTVPAERMKVKAAKAGDGQHRVPLSPRALDLLRSIHVTLGEAERQPESLIFGRSPTKMLSNMAMGMLLRRMDVNAGGKIVTVHGFRSTFRDWAAETTPFPHEVCEMALAHTIKNKAEAAYRRGDLFEKRRELMDAWAAYCS